MCGETVCQQTKTTPTIITNECDDGSNLHRIYVRRAPRMCTQWNTHEQSKRDHNNQSDTPRNLIYGFKFSYIPGRSRYRQWNGLPNHNQAVEGGVKRTAGLQAVR